MASMLPLRRRTEKASVVFKSVRRFQEAALAASGTDEDTPGIRENYNANYYGAFVRDPDGNKIEAVTYTAGERFGLLDR